MHQYFNKTFNRFYTFDDAGVKPQKRSIFFWDYCPSLWLISLLLPAQVAKTQTVFSRFKTSVNSFSP